MTDYRLYALSDNRIVRVVELDCDDDDSAIVEASAHACAQPMELWQRARLVKRFPADKTTSMSTANPALS
ncbi:MAG: hypothetical protein JO111_08215 [Caulobacteraceae bacterium]|nr:hypothetical protein [Caulobacteraceae bacterium]